MDLFNRKTDSLYEYHFWKIFSDRNVSEKILSFRTSEKSLKWKYWETYFPRSIKISDENIPFIKKDIIALSEDQVNSLCQLTFSDIKLILNIDSRIIVLPSIEIILRLQRYDLYEYLIKQELIPIFVNLTNKTYQEKILLLAQRNNLETTIRYLNKSLIV